MVVEDQVLFRDMLVKLINSQGDMRVEAVLGEARTAPEACERLAPDLILMDVLTDQGPGGKDEDESITGITAAGRIRRDHPGVKIIIMTALPEITLINAARRAGVHSFVYKNVKDEVFLSTIRNTVAGYNTFPEKPPVPLPFRPNFSDREIRVLRAFCRGKTRGEIAGDLGVSEALVKAIITGLLNKTGFDSIMRLAVFLTANGYILPQLGDKN